ncbi:MAG TPA: class I SAM-dependent methyltransferase [Dehalococcoidia bacterium]|nr:class I SAM-dependent methyltransferase [Dehalococcoidia bacterium]
MTEQPFPLTITDLISRAIPPEPWAEGEKFPWNDPDFSRRMLSEHLSQEHGMASRQGAVIDEHVDWLHQRILDGRPSRVLDLACGPGLYTSRLAQLGHECTGIDFGPASIAYAREAAEHDGLSCRYLEGDLRTTDFAAPDDSPYDLAMLIYGEFNVFRSKESRDLLRKARAVLAPGARLVLEPHTYDAVRRSGEAPPAWSSAAQGLFSDDPHLRLDEAFWDAKLDIATQRYYIVDAASGRVQRHAASMQAYSDAQYAELLVETGFTVDATHGMLTGSERLLDDDLLVTVATAV